MSDDNSSYSVKINCCLTEDLRDIEMSICTQPVYNTTKADNTYELSHSNFDLTSFAHVSKSVADIQPQDERSEEIVLNKSNIKYSADSNPETMTVAPKSLKKSKRSKLIKSNTLNVSGHTK